MAFTDLLQDTATFKTISFTQGALGNEIKQDVVLYDSIRCDIRESNRRNVGTNSGEAENYRDIWACKVEPQYNGANRGDRVEANGGTFLINRKQEVKGAGGVHHILYYLEEQI